MVLAAKEVVDGAARTVGVDSTADAGKVRDGLTCSFSLTTIEEGLGCAIARADFLSVFWGAATASGGAVTLVLLLWLSLVMVFFVEASQSQSSSSSESPLETGALAKGVRMRVLRLGGGGVAAGGLSAK